MMIERPQGEIVVRPVPEHRADEQLSAVYRDLKTTLGVPWVGVIVQAIAYYRPFFIEVWRQLRPIAASHAFEDGSEDVRRLARDRMASAFTIPAHVTPLEAAGYSDRELAQIRGTLDLFEYGNPKYLILATAIAESLAKGRTLGRAAGADSRDRLARPLVPHADAIPPMIEEHHASDDLRAVYDDIKATLNLPFVNSDYKAMARWPSYLAYAWPSLKPVLGDHAYALLRESIHNRALDIVDSFPFPYRMDRGAASAAGLSSPSIDELCRAIVLFQWLLSGLILNVTYFRLALEPRR
jgi:hypothetical protein